jgi:hypothetical protein
VVSVVGNTARNKIVPSFKAMPQRSVITSQDDDKVNPAFREELAGMPIKDEPSCRS